MDLLNLSPSLHDSLSLKCEAFTEMPADNGLKYATMDEVRIIPAKIVFDAAFDGKVFNQSVTIINCGKYSAFVRILPPSSKAFKLKPVPRGCKLSAGMSISRNVSYTHTSAMALPEASFLVYINEKPLVYQIEVILNSAFVVSSPKILDFGKIDARNPSEPKTIKLVNKGRKVSQFSVDLGRSEVDLIIRPLKGSIDPFEVIEMSVEVLGSDLGPFDKEFWIRTEPPQRVRITGILIEPKLALVYPLVSHKLALVDFSRTYFGAEIRKTIVLKNNSSIASMFCIVFENNTGVDCLEKARNKNDDLKCFSANPMEGRLQVQQKYPIQFTFRPRQSKSFTERPYKDFALVFLRVVKVHFRDGRIGDDQIKSYEATSDSTEQESAEPLEATQPFYVSGLDEDLRLCLYGEMEIASVKLTPGSFSITYLRVRESYIYELNIKNMSTSLPITVLYNKIASVDIEPKQTFLKPECCIEATLRIKPSRVGPVDVNVVFDLIYEGKNERCKVGNICLPLQYLATMECPPIEPKFNLGITPELQNEVGCFVQDVRFNSNVNKPVQAIVDKHFKRFNDKNNTDLIAFPNDRPKSLRPWTNKTVCRTIYTNIPRYSNPVDEYALKDAEVDAKKYCKQIYTDFVRNSSKIRQQKIKPSSILPHYDIGDKSHILMEDVYYADCTSYSSISQTVNNVYVALSPKKLLGVKITPRYMELGELAPYTTCKESFFIENENDFSISVSIKALSNAILIKGKQTMIINAQTKKQIFFDCWSHGIGNYYVPVYIIVNDHHIFDATISAKVVPTTVLCPIEELTMDLKDGKACFEVFNPLNCDVTFSWEVQDDSFDVYPPSGKIPPKGSLYNMVTFCPHDDALHKNEIYLISQSGAKQNILVACEITKADVGFNTTKLRFENIPLNKIISKELVLRNFSDMAIGFSIVNPNPLSEITVLPSTGILGPRSDECFIINVNFKDIVDFKCDIEFIMQHMYSYHIGIEGNVIYPEIFLEPAFIQFPKMASGSYQRRVFRVTNVSEAQCYVDFCVEDFPEFFIVDLDKNNINECITMEPGESRELFLEFKPVEPVVYSVYLPYVINGIIGPPALNDPRSLSPSIYFNTTNDSFITAINLPDTTLPIIAIRCSAGAPCVEMSSLYLNFSSSNKQNEKLWTITNVCSTVHILDIPLVDSESYFNLSIEDASDFKVTNKYYEASINPSEEVVFRITFTPSEFGTYDLELPIFLNKSVEACPFNYLKLTGTHFKPAILCSKSALYYQIIPTKEQANATVTLELIGHKNDCRMETEIRDDTLSVNFTESIDTQEGSSKLEVSVTFNPKEECSIDTQIIFKCDCETSCTLAVKAGANDCILESYESFIKMKAAVASKEFKSTFPYFPAPSDDSFYAQRMKFVCSNLERILFTQRIYSRVYLKIPEGFCRILLPIQPAGKANSGSKFGKSETPTLPLVNILTHLINPKVGKYFTDSNLVPKFEGTEGAVYVYSTYRNILTFLKSQNVFVSQLEPEYLLPYNLYTIFKQSVSREDPNQNSSGSILSEEEFYSFSKQCWLDLSLKLYKVFVYDRILIPRAGKSKQSRQGRNDVYHKDFMKYYSENKAEMEEAGQYFTEIKLLLWLEFHYETQKSVLFDFEEYPHLKVRRKFRNFENDFPDVIVLATLIFAYCPYLKEDLQKFYPTLECPAKLFHNSCLIYETIKKIKLPDNLMPPRQEKLNTIDLVMVTSYLYDTLPGFYPRETIELSASLGDSAANEINLKNNNDYTIAYTPVFFSNDKNEFEVDSDCVIIPPKKQKCLKISYNAKSVIKTTSVLVLTGETEGFKPTKAMAINLIGIPKIFEFTESFRINVNVYEGVKKFIDVGSPFEQPYTAKLYMYYGDTSKAPEDISDFIPVTNQKLRNVPRQLCMDAQCIFDDDGFTTLQLSLCYICVGDFEYYIYMINEDVGDFCIKLHVNSKLGKTTFMDLDVKIQKYFSTTVGCSCNISQSNICQCKSVVSSCSKLIVAEIPFRNDQLVEAIQLMFKISTEEHESEFWTKLLEYPKGFHILRNRLRNSFAQFCLPYTNVLSPMVKYKVEFSQNLVSVPEYVTFNNVTSSRTFKFPMHWNHSARPTEEVLTLHAEHNQETRRYRLNFK